MTFGLLAFSITILGLMLSMSWVQASILIHPNSPIPTQVLPNIGNPILWQPVRFSTSDDLQLEGWYHPPAEANGASVIFVHGHAGNRAQSLPLAGFLIEAGYGTLVFDLRNHGRSDGDVTTMGLEETKDVQAAYDFLASKPAVDENKIAVFGHSMGGSTAILTMAAIAQLRAVVVDTAFTSMADVVRDGVPLRTGLPPLFFHHLVLRIGNFLARNNLYQVRPIDAVVAMGPRPILLIHGTEDAVIPVHHSQILFEAATGPKEIYIVEGSGHATNYSSNPEEYERRVLSFLADNLSTD